MGLVALQNDRNYFFARVKQVFGKPADPVALMASDRVEPLPAALMNLKRIPVAGGQSFAE